jgi:hypothetical protein
LELKKKLEAREHELAEARRDAAEARQRLAEAQRQAAESLEQQAATSEVLGVSPRPRRASTAARALAS